MVALARTVTVNNKTFVKGTDHTAIPGWAIDQIRNPDNWVGGVAPAMAHTVPEQPVEAGLSPTQLRTKLGLGGAATKNVGTTSGTVAAGDDARIVGAAQRASNLADLANAGTARTNLGLGAAATKAVGTTASDVAAGNDSRIVGAVQQSANLSDLASAGTARTNLGLGAAATKAVGTTSSDVAAGNDARIVGAAQLASAPTFTGAVTAPSIGVPGQSGAPNPGRFVGVTATGAPTSGSWLVGDIVVTQNGQMFVCTVAGSPGVWVNPRDISDRLAAGEETMPRDILFHTSIAQTSGQCRLNYFTARKTETTSQVRLHSGSIAAAATPTLCKMGLWEIAANGDGTLVAVTANDTTLFAATSTAYTRSWVTPYAKKAGQRYAAGVLVVSAATMPQFQGAALTNSAELFTAPAVVGMLAGLSDLGNFAAGSVAATATRNYIAILP